MPMRSISYAMGARGDFLSHFLWNNVYYANLYKYSRFDYIKIHDTMEPAWNLDHHPRILIDYGIDSCEMITFFMWEKTTKNMFKELTAPFDQFTKIYFTMVDAWQEQKLLRQRSYSHVVDFEKFFDTDHMSKFYQQVNNQEPSKKTIDFLIANNLLQKHTFESAIVLHPVRVAFLIMEFEEKNNLHESQRNWSIVDLWQKHTKVTQEFLHELKSLLNQKNYSDKI